ncbi:MAG: hypothetical protein RLZZ21_871 [Planctomycetota bacterium]
MHRIPKDAMIDQVVAVNEVISGARDVLPVEIITANGRLKSRIQSRAEVDFPAKDACSFVAIPEEAKSDASRCLQLEIGEDINVAASRIETIARYKNSTRASHLQGKGSCLVGPGRSSLRYSPVPSRAVARATAHTRRQIGLERRQRAAWPALRQNNGH